MTKSWDAQAHAPTHAIGVDVGGAVDFSALAVVSQVTVPGAFDERTETFRPRTHLHVRHLQRIELGNPFAALVAAAVQWRTHPALVVPAVPDLGRPAQHPTIILDATGVGRPLVETFREQHKCPVVPVVITGGEKVNRGAGGYRVPKADLVGQLVVEFEQRRIKIAGDLPLANTLLDELQNFRMSISASGHATYDARPGTHDDLLTAVSLGVWYLRTRPGRAGTMKMAFSCFS